MELYCHQLQPERAALLAFRARESSRKQPIFVLLFKIQRAQQIELIINYADILFKSWYTSSRIRTLKKTAKIVQEDDETK